MRKGLLVAVCTTVVAVTIVAGFLSVRKMNNREAFSDERAYRNAVDLDLRYDDFEEAIAKDPTISGNYQELRDAASEAYKILNNERAAHNLEPMMWDYALEICAQTRAEEIAYVFESGHTRPNGTAWYTVNPRVLLGENIYKGKKSADKVMASWLSNEADKENFLSNDFTKTAICVFSNDKGEYYWVATFGAELADITFEN